VARLADETRAVGWRQAGQGLVEHACALAVRPEAETRLLAELVEAADADRAGGGEPVVEVALAGTDEARRGGVAHVHGVLVVVIVDVVDVVDALIGPSWWSSGAEVPPPPPAIVVVLVADGCWDRARRRPTAQHELTARRPA
jgi:hypothetical protein